MILSSSVCRASLWCCDTGLFCQDGKPACDQDLYGHCEHVWPGMHCSDCLAQSQFLRLKDEILGKTHSL